MAVEPSKHVLNNPEKIDISRSIISNARLLFIKRVVPLSISLVNKNHAEQARKIMTIVSTRLPKKQDLTEHTVDEYKVANLIDVPKKPAMKRSCKGEREAGINDSRSCRRGKKRSVKLLAGKYRQKERLLDD